MRIFLTFAAAIFYLAGCSEIAEPGSSGSSKTELLEGIYSYSKPDQISALITKSGDVKVVENSKSPSRGPCPRFDIYTIEVNNWSHLNTQGSLQINFVNESLYRTLFFPVDMQDYLAKLKAAGFSLSSQEQESIIGNVVITYATNWQNRDYVSWTDGKIAKEVNSWIRSCA